MKYSAAIIKKDGSIAGKAFESKEEAEEWILAFLEKDEIKKARIKDLNTGIEEIIL
jgi:hypothetical protein